MEVTGEKSPEKTGLVKNYLYEPFFWISIWEGYKSMYFLQFNSFKFDNRLKLKKKEKIVWLDSIWKGLAI